MQPPVRALVCAFSARLQTIQVVRPRLHHDGEPVTKMYNSAWKKARARAGLKKVRVHDLRHTFVQRLRAAGVSLEDRKALLGHKSGDVTTHYSAAELAGTI